MSIGLLVSTTEEGDTYMGVFPERFYTRHVLPLTYGSEFFWLRLLGTGFPIDEQNRSELIEEIYSLSTIVAESEMETSVQLIIQQRLVSISYWLARTTSFSAVSLYLG